MEKHTKGPVLIVDLCRHAFAPCVKVCVSMKSFPGGCRRYEVSYTAKFSTMDKYSGRLWGLHCWYVFIVNSRLKKFLSKMA